MLPAWWWVWQEGVPITCLPVCPPPALFFASGHTFPSLLCLLVLGLAGGRRAGDGTFGFRRCQQPPGTPVAASAHCSSSHRGTGVDLLAISLRLTACEHGRALNSLYVKHLEWFLSSRLLTARERNLPSGSKAILDHSPSLNGQNSLQTQLIALERELRMVVTYEKYYKYFYFEKL